MVDMPQCQDCRWWEPITDSPGDGECLRLSVANDFYGDKYQLLAAGPATANIVTGELFGCVKFEAKTDG